MRRPTSSSAANSHALGFLDKKRMANEAAEALAELNPNFTDLDRPVRLMSGGQRQAIAIARAIHFNVRVLIMDEPTAALGRMRPRRSSTDPQAARPGIAILLVSHDVRNVLNLANRIVVLKDGEIVGRLLPRRQRGRGRRHDRARPARGKPS